LNEKLLSIKGLKTYFYFEEGIIKAVDGVDLTLDRGEILGIVGESGSGKTLTCLSIMKLLPPGGKIVEGDISLSGTNLIKLSDEEMRNVRGQKISMIFQDPMSSLNPVFTIEDQISETITVHKKMAKPEVKKMVIENLEKVGIPDPLRRIREYPHQLSGGMRQRVMIAMAISLNPDLILADEPTSNLDLTTQAQVLELLKKLNGEYNSSMILVTHDLGIVANFCHKIFVMYAGKPVEYADTITLFKSPKHPYTEALIKSNPRLDIDVEKLETIPGRIPTLYNPPKGCRYGPRCSYATERCREAEPAPVEVRPGHITFCEFLGGK
jgi:oligopeptide/dipeptide ABC transporter ATP-binding protein